MDPSPAGQRYAALAQPPVLDTAVPVPASLRAGKFQDEGNLVGVALHQYRGAL